MRLTASQMSALGGASERRYEEEVHQHLQRFFSEQCEFLGRDGTLEAVRHGIRRAATYGITGERDVCLYIDLMFALGRDFDVSPNFAWARTILTSGDLPASLRVQRVYDAALDYLDGADGSSR